MSEKSKVDMELERLLENPDVLKALAKALKANSAVATAPKLKPHTREASYVNVTMSRCSLCGAESIFTYVMAFDSVERCHRILYQVRPGFAPPPELPVRKIHITADNCDACYHRLMDWPKDTLIELLINKDKRTELHFHSIVEIAKEVNGED